MAKTITLKNLPDALHARLAAAAKRHQRSLNNEAIVCLEAGLGHVHLAAEQQSKTDPAEIDAFNREDRP